MLSERHWYSLLNGAHLYYTDVFLNIRHTCALTVIPLALSTGSWSRTCRLSASLGRQPENNKIKFYAYDKCPPVNSMRRSASVLLPWSTWATMQKFRIFSCGTVHQACKLQFSNLDLMRILPQSSNTWNSPHRIFVEILQISAKETSTEYA